MASVYGQRSAVRATGQPCRSTPSSATGRPITDDAAPSGEVERVNEAGARDAANSK
jgi:hypothetical protein